MRSQVLWRAACAAAVWLLCWQLPSTARASADDMLQSQFATLVQSFDGDVQSALHDIDGLPRQLLAASSYLRAGEGLRSRWSWTDAQMADFERSARYRQMLGDIQRLTAQFEALNPGFTLYVNTQVRSLGVQLERWNKNRAVGLLADELQAAALAAATAGQSLRQFLRNWQPSAAAPLAAPGLSLHGRGQVLDFQIRKGDRIIAGTEAANVPSDWDGPGWTQKLQLAVQRSGLPFRGPLRAPREPWHYEYLPEQAPPQTAPAAAP
jgi:hypothetical protein